MRGGAVDDQLGDRLSRGRRVEDAPDAVAGRDIAAGDAGNSADQRQAVARHRPEAGLPRDDRRFGQHRRQRAAHRLQPIERPVIGRDARRVERHHVLAGDAADIGGAVGAWEQLRRQHRTRLLPVFEEGRLRRDAVAGFEHQAVAFQPEHRRQRQPLRGEDRPRPHRDHHCVARDGRAIDFDAGEPPVSPGDAANPSRPQFGAVRPGGAHHRGGELAGMDLRCRFRRAECLAHPHAGGKPVELVGIAVVAVAVVLAGEAAIGIEPAIAPFVIDSIGKLGVQIEAALRQRSERCTVAPVARQKPA